MGEEFENGFQVKDIKIQQLQLTDVRPKLEEVTKFASGAEDGTENLDLKQLAASLKDANALTTYLPGDIIEVYEGEQSGVVGRAINVQGDIVTLKVTEGALKNQTIEVPSRGLRKRFKVGDHVKVIGGSRYQDEVGMVVKISQDRVTLLADQSNTEITVFSKDLREADDIGGQGSIGNFELLDLVQIDSTTVGCVVKIDRESLVVLDQQGDTRQMVPSSIANKLTKKNTVAADRSGSEIRLGDVVKEYGGQQRRGKILHIWHGFVFLHSHDSNENSGVFVTRAASVNTVAAKGGRVNAPVGPDLTAMNPALKRNPIGNDGKMLPPPKLFGRDKAIGQTVIIKRGGYKGLLGIVKDTTDASARVELHSKNKTITVPKEHLSFKDKHTGAKIDISARGPRPYGGSQGSDRRVPDWQSGSRTPATSGLPDRTPAWGGSGSRSKLLPSKSLRHAALTFVPAPAFSGGRTPAWGRSGGDLGARTPAWQDGSRTVYGQDGNRTSYGSSARTPAWQSGSKTPAIDSYGAGSRTPAYASDSWSGSKTPGYVGSAPTPAASGNDSWGYTPAASGASHPYDAPTPGASLLGAPTPGAALNAPTPGAYAAPTPAAVGPPTPGATWSSGWGDTAPTPAAGAPTPAASGFAGGYYGAPTPGAYGGAAETPAASGPRYTDDDDD
jgi:transcription elongation factor SPT5